MIGQMHAASFASDPKHLGFVFARYKFVAKMLAGKKRVLEIGCGDCTGAQVVKPEVGLLVGIDRELIAPSPAPILVAEHDINNGPFKNVDVPEWDAIYLLDVMEHIPAESENWVLCNIKDMIGRDGIVIVGMPSKESQPYASPLSKQLHVNCKTEHGLRSTLEQHFRNVFLFGMNDETLHTGFGPMCQYRIAICANKM